MDLKPWLLTKAIISGCTFIIQHETEEREAKYIEQILPEVSTSVRADLAL